MSDKRIASSFFFLQTCLDPHKIHFALKLPQQTGNSSRGKQQPCGSEAASQAGACCAPFFVQSAAFWVESLNRLWQWCASIRRNRRRRHYQTAHKHRDKHTSNTRIPVWQGMPWRAEPRCLPACLPACQPAWLIIFDGVAACCHSQHGVTARHGMAGCPLGGISCQ